MLTRWLTRVMELLKEIPEDFQANIDEIPDKKKDETEKGILSHELASMYKVLYWVAKKIMEFKEKHEKECSGCSEEQCEEFARQLAMMKVEHDAIKEMLFASIRYEFGLSPLDYPALGIRKGGIIVALPPEKEKGTSHTIIIGSMGLPKELKDLFAGFGVNPR